MGHSGSADEGDDASAAPDRRAEKAEEGQLTLPSATGASTLAHSEADRQAGVRNLSGPLGGVRHRPRSGLPPHERTDMLISTLEDLTATQRVNGVCWGTATCLSPT